MNLVTQAALNTIRDHLVQQKALAVRTPDSGACMIRTPCGLKCAVRALIPDERYEESMESSSAWTIRQNHPDVFDKALDLSPVQLWLSYHDSTLFGSRSERPEGFSYQKWIDGNEFHHPNFALEAIRKEYGLV